MKTLKDMQKGFTLVEIMIVVAIIGILASIAIPSYRDYVVKSSLAEATSGLADRRSRMEQFFQDRRTYTGADVAPPIVDPPLPIPPCVEDETGTNFNFSCDVADNAYTITATGKSTAAGFSFTVNESNARATTLAATGWTANTSCWIRKKDGTC